MDRILIEGGYPLKGTVKVSGAKNAALPVLAACLLTGGWHHLKRIPNLRDVHTIKLILSRMGVVFREENGGFAVNSENLDKYLYEGNE